uniref:murein transglycosylase A n=1 Tax=Neokomagataea thailandica TaxID=661190 RepID=UPI002265E2B0|nr:MltA domain-containing protein [Neokomagataea thailandica]
MMRTSGKVYFRLSLLGGIILIASQSGAAAKSPHAMRYAALSGWRAENIAVLLPLLRAQCKRMGQLPPETLLGGSDVLPSGRYAGEWSASCTALQSLTSFDALKGRRFIEKWFRPYLLTDSAEITGYYQPVFQASLTRGGAYKVPLYARPADLTTTTDSKGQQQSGRWVKGVFEPYLDRAHIDHGALAGQGLEIAWLKSSVDRFFLQIQGSGILQLPDGRRVAVAYDGRNGQPYVPLGREMVRDGLLNTGSVSMDSIRAWLEAHPSDAQPYMERNPNYVFFRLEGAASAFGPKGALGVPLMPWRSVAVDRTTLPLGLPLWVQTSLPLQNGSTEHWQHMVLAQDVGTDIRGVGRLDLFTGSGEQSAYVAGHMHASGRIIMLLPRSENVIGAAQ